jgi:hypothetical protein
MMSLKKIINDLYQTDATKRTIVICILFQMLLWIVFGISYLLNSDAWINVREVEQGAAAVGGSLTTFIYIIIMNSIVCSLIAAGNIFVRFGKVTVGALVLIIQAISIGWLAGSNAFEVPFVTMSAANIRFLSIGLFETLAYSITGAVTLTKSLYIADTFPAKKWVETKKIKDIRLSKSEFVILLIGLTCLIIAAFNEAIALVG